MADDYDEIAKVWGEAGLSVRRSGRDGPMAFVRQLSHFPDLYLKAVVGTRIVGVVFGTHDQRKGWIHYCLALRHQTLRSLGITVDRLVINTMLGLVALGAAYGLIIPWALAMQAFAPETAQGFHKNAEAIMSFFPRQSPLRFLWLALVIGFYEELFFRGFLMTRLRRLLGGWTWAAIVSSIVFVAPHMIEQEPIALVPIAILAAIFCVVTIWRRSIVPALVAHWLFNLSQFLLLYFTSGDTWQ